MRAQKAHYIRKAEDEHQKHDEVKGWLPGFFNTEDQNSDGNDEDDGEEDDPPVVDLEVAKVFNKMRNQADSKSNG